MPELLAAMSVASTIAAAAIPAVGGFRDRLAVERQAARVIEGYQRTRTVAMEAGGGAVLRILPAGVTIHAFGEDDSALVYRAAGPEEDGVALDATIDRVFFTPNGLSLGIANGRFTLSRGGITRELVASRLGRLRVVRPRRLAPRRRGRPGPRYRAAS